MQGHEVAQAMANEFVTRDLNEADVRFKIVNRILLEVLSWPHGNINCEEKVHPGYVDFILRDKAKRTSLVIETKKEGKHFILPSKITKGSNQFRRIRLKTLATEANILNAIQQAAQYCPTIGCQFACVTNGHEWILFRSFIPGIDFMEADAIVIPKLIYFAEQFTHAYNLLGFNAVTSERSLQRTLGTEKLLGRELFYPKNGITHYDAEVQKNE